MREDYGDKGKASHWSRSPPRPPRERFELGDGRKPGEAGQGLPVPLVELFAGGFKDCFPELTVGGLLRK